MFGWFRRLQESPASQDADEGVADADGPESQPDEIGYSSDAPVGEPWQDQFRRWPFSQRIAQVIASRTDPSSLVIAIYGAWGEGKTSILNFMHKELTRHEHLVPVRFNPWRYGAEEDLLESFFTQIASAVGRKLRTRSEEFGDILRRYGGATGAIPKIGETLSGAAGGAAAILGSPDIEELRERIEEILRVEKKRVVVLVDDIDRLEKQEIHALFRLVKLTADFKYTSYVLAFDEEMVAAALQERYAGSQSRAGHAFLEKIVQVPLHIPAAPTAILRRFCFTGVDSALAAAGIELSENDAREFARDFTRAFDVRLRTPRKAKLYGNALQFALPILKGEVHTGDLMLVEGMRVFYPRLYSLIRGRPDLVVGLTSGRERAADQQNEEIKAALALGMEGLSADEMEAAQYLLQRLFPRLKQVYSNVRYGREWDETWSRHQRVAAKDYFGRYFAYAIPEGDVSDAAIAELATVAEQQDEDQLEACLRAILNQHTAESVVSKLRRDPESLGPVASARLANAVALSGAVFPDPDTLFGSLFTPRAQAAMLVATLVGNLPPGERVEKAREIINTADPVSFAARCLRWMSVHDPASPDEADFSVEEFKLLGTILGNRIASVTEEAGSVFALEDKDARESLLAWATYGEPDQARERVTREIDQNPDSAVQLLQMLRPTAWGGESGLPQKSDFERSQYDLLASLVDPEVVATAISKKWPDLSTPETYPRLIGESGADVVAQQFLWIHGILKAEKSAEANKPVDPKREQDE